MANATVIAGRYRVEGRLGVGGMSTVQLAFDQRLERYVALKLLAEHLADDPAFVSRFRREALSAARLVHPNIVQVFDFGFDERQHQHFIVMEHVQGRSCAELLRDRGQLEVEEAVNILTQACRGLEYAHRNGVVHRDVKPGNLLVSESDVVKLADFGIARATDQSSITQAGSVLGTAAYLAPEQARGEEAGPRSDLYSLGVVAYQLLSGRLPYEASSLSELALKQQRASPRPLDTLNPNVPPELALAVASALALDSGARPANALLLAESLRDGAYGSAPSSTASTRYLDGPWPTRGASLEQAAAAGTRLGGRAPTTGRSPTEATRAAQRPGTEATRAAQRPGTEARAAPRTGTEATRTVRGPHTDPTRAADWPEAEATRTPGWPEPRPAAAAPDAYRRRMAPGYADRRRTGGNGRAFRWLIGLLALGCLIAAVVVVAVSIANSTSAGAVHIQHVVAHDAQSAINQVRGLVKQYTK